jgi:hypothetical protein
MRAIFPKCTDENYIVSVLQQNNIISVCAVFSGRDDNVEIHGLYFHERDAEGMLVAKDIGHLPVDGWEKHEGVENGRWKYKVVRDRTTLSEQFKRICCDALEATTLDWCSGHGGRGQLDILLNEKGELEFDLEIGIHVVEVVSHDFRFNGNGTELL